MAPKMETKVDRDGPTEVEMEVEVERKIERRDMWG